jgi:hypothetical protein
MSAIRARVISAAARNNIPAVYAIPFFARDGGLLSYGPDQVGTFRGGASYVGRILRGERPGDLPVQLPIKLEMIVNLKTVGVAGYEPQFGGTKSSALLHRRLDVVVVHDLAPADDLAVQQRACCFGRSLILWIGRDAGVRP